MGNQLTATDPANQLEFERLLPNAPFGETHSRMIDQPVDKVWDSLLATTGNDIKLLEPLFRLRNLPAKLLGKTLPESEGGRPIHDLFADEGFVTLRRDERPVDGHAVYIFGAAGKFWSPAHNNPMTFESPQAFIEFDEPGYAKTVARFEVYAVGDRTFVETETVVAGNDEASTRKFRPYWMLIRGPSGLLRRSWLAGIDRRANQ